VTRSRKRWARLVLRVGDRTDANWVDEQTWWKRQLGRLRRRFTIILK
jgi:hypothetical protein